MPIYTYICPKCKIREDRLVKLDERDSQKCEAVNHLELPCGEKLDREEISETANMASNWSQW